MCSLFVLEITMLYAKQSVSTLLLMLLLITITSGCCCETSVRPYNRGVGYRTEFSLYDAFNFTSVIDSIISDKCRAFNQHDPYTCGIVVLCTGECPQWHRQLDELWTTYARQRSDDRMDIQIVLYDPDKPKPQHLYFTSDGAYGTADNAITAGPVNPLTPAVIVDEYMIDGSGRIHKVYWVEFDMKSPSWSDVLWFVVRAVYKTRLHTMFR